MSYLLRSRLFRYATVLWLAGLPSSLAAQPAHLVADLVPEPQSRSSVPRELVELNGMLYFTADHPLTGRELWRWDGTAPARLVKDLCPGRCSRQPQQLVPFQGRLYFLAEAGKLWDLDLYSTDGTPAGTDLVAERVLPTPSRLVATSRSLFFESWTADTGWELWRSDGTAGGTGLVADLRPGPSSSLPVGLTPVGDVLYFVARDDAGSWLYRTDGSLAGTWKVTDVRPLPPRGHNDEESFFHHDGRLYFTSEQGGCGLWSTDGTAEGTSKLHSFPPVNVCLELSEHDMVMTADGVLFFSLNEATTGDRLWRSDGTDAGTFRLADAGSGSVTVPPFDLTEVNGQVFFAATENGDSELWVTDGTAAGTHRVRNINPADDSWPESLTAFADQLLFVAKDETAGRSVWISDGTENGTRLVSDIHPLPTFSGAEEEDRQESEVVLFGSRIALVADDGVHGAELWMTDGTTAGTVLAADVDGNVGSSDPTELLVLERRSEPKEQLAFLAGNDVWVANGREHPVNVTHFDDEGWRLRDLIRVGDHVFWTRSRSSYQGELWTFEISEQVPRKLAELDCSAPSLLDAFQGRLFFIAPDWSREEVYGLYESDGTDAGTLRVANLPELVFLDDRELPELCLAMSAVELGGLLYVSAGSYFLVTDGTARGTGPLFEDCGRPFECGQFGEVVRMDDAIYFPLTRPVRQGGQVQELWRSSGVSVPANLLASFPPFGPSPGSWLRSIELRDLTVAADRLFFVAETEEEGVELWTSDGTAAGTRLVIDLFPGPVGSSPGELFADGAELYFSARHPAGGRELWVTDGTPEGTRQVADLHRGPGSSDPQELTKIDGLLVFAADDGVHGLEPWISDGTAEGTRLLQDVQRGILPSAPRSFVAAGEDVFFNAGTLARGLELWSLPRSALRIEDTPDNPRDPSDRPTGRCPDDRGAPGRRPLCRN